MSEKRSEKDTRFYTWNPHKNPIVQTCTVSICCKWSCNWLVLFLHKMLGFVSFFVVFVWFGFFSNVEHLVANLWHKTLYLCMHGLILKLLQSPMKRQNKPGLALQFWSCRSSSGKLWTPSRSGYQMTISGCKHHTLRTCTQTLRIYTKYRVYFQNCWISKLIKLIFSFGSALHFISI